MPKDHIVRQGECLSRIASLYGFRDYRTIYEHSLNAGLRKKRPNPNLLHPGDIVVVPDKESRSETCPTGDIHRFVLKRSLRKLRLRMLEHDGTPLANTDYVLT